MCFVITQEVLVFAAKEDHGVQPRSHQQHTFFSTMEDLGIILQAIM